MRKWSGGAAAALSLGGLYLVMHGVTIWFMVPDKEEETHGACASICNPDEYRRRAELLRQVRMGMVIMGCIVIGLAWAGGDGLNFVPAAAVHFEHDEAQARRGDCRHCSHCQGSTIEREKGAPMETIPPHI